MTMTLEEKLQELREKWKENPDKRKTIELQARALKIAIEKRNAMHPFKKEMIELHEDKAETAEDIFADIST